MKYLSPISLLFTLGLLTACATLNSSGERVQIVSVVGKDCKNLGPVNVSVTGWGLPVENQNVLRNNTAEKGGNTLFQNGEGSGIAYECPLNSESR